MSISKLVPVFFISFLLLCCSACGGNKKAARQNAEIFIEAYYSEKYEETRKVSTYTTQKLVDKTAYYHSLNPSFSKNKTKVKSNIESVVLLQDGEKAIIRYKINNSERTLYMSKTDKGWMVDMDEKHPIEVFLGPQSRPGSGEKEDAGVASSESGPISIGDIK